MQVFKRYSAAKKAADGKPIIRVGSTYKNSVYIVVEDTLVGIQLTTVDLIAPSGLTAGHITMGHLERLGNGNWATPEVRTALADKLNDVCFPDGPAQRKPKAA